MTTTLVIANVNHDLRVLPFNPKPKPNPYYGKSCLRSTLISMTTKPTVVQIVTVILTTTLVLGLLAGIMDDVPFALVNALLAGDNEDVPFSKSALTKALHTDIVGRNPHPAFTLTQILGIR